MVAGTFLGADRLAALRAAAREPAAGPGLGQLQLIVRIPVDGGDPQLPALTDGRARLAGFERAGAGGPGRAAERAAAVEPEHVSDILFTSGTTGRSKGVMCAHRQSLNVARAWAECGEVTRATATWSSTRSSTASATRPGSSSAC